MTSHTVTVLKVGDNYQGGIVSETTDSHITIEMNTGPYCTELERDIRGLMCVNCPIGLMMARAANNGGTEGPCPHSPYSLKQHLHDEPGRLTEPWEAVQACIEVTPDMAQKQKYKELLQKFLSQIARHQGSSDHDDTHTLVNGYVKLQEKLDEQKALWVSNHRPNGVSVAGSIN